MVDGVLRISKAGPTGGLVGSDKVPIARQNLTAALAGTVDEIAAYVLGTGSATPFLPTAGGTMYGPIVLAGNASSPLEAVPFQQLNTAMSGGPWLPTRGGNMTGPLNYIATGGTLMRSAQSRAADIINVKEYGATGNGSTDDTVAIQAALNALQPGGAVRLPAGNYYISAPLVIPTSALSPNGFTGGITISGDGLGVTFFTTQMTATPFITCALPSGSAAFHLTIQDLSCWPYLDYNAYHIDIQNVCSCTIRRVGLLSTPSIPAISGARIRGVGGGIFYARVQDCEFLGCTLCYDNITDAWIEGNVLQATGGSGTGGQRAYSVYLTNITGNVKIHHNHIYATAKGAIYCDNVGGAGQNSWNSVIGNEFDLSPSAVPSSIGINLIGSTVQWIIQSNVFGGQSGSSIIATDAVGCIITSNLFIDTGQTAGAPAVLFAKSVTGCSNNIVSNNTGWSNQSTAVYLISENDNSCSGHLYFANKVAGSGYQAAPVHLGAGNVRGQLSLSGGLTLGTESVTTATDLSRHLDIYGGQFGLNVGPSGIMGIVTQGNGANVYVAGTRVAVFTNTGIDATDIGDQYPANGTFVQVKVGSTTGPTWTTGTTAPASTQPVGSLYSRVGGAVGATLYVSRGAGTWAAVAGV